jgi:hypothetical protein
MSLAPSCPGSKARALRAQFKASRCFRVHMDAQARSIKSSTFFSLLEDAAACRPGCFLLAGFLVIFPKIRLGFLKSTGIINT